MASLIFDEPGKHFYETGVSHGVLYPKFGTLVTNTDYAAGVAWNGLTAVTESPSGAEATALYADDIKYLNLYSAEDFGLTIEAYQAPKEFEQCDGSKSPVLAVTVGQQPRKSFGFSYISKIGNDTDGDSHGELIHLVYNCTASPSEKSRETINDSPSAVTFSWEITTIPETAKTASRTFKPVAHISIDTRYANSTKVGILKNLLYGTVTDSPQLPTIATVLSLFNVT